MGRNSDWTASIGVGEALGITSVADYTVIDCQDSLVVINALTGLTPKQTAENLRDCTWLRPTVTTPPYVLQSKYHDEPRCKTGERKSNSSMYKKDQEEASPTFKLEIPSLKMRRGSASSDIDDEALMSDKFEPNQEGVAET